MGVIVITLLWVAVKRIAGILFQPVVVWKSLRQIANSFVWKWTDNAKICYNTNFEEIIFTTLQMIFQPVK